MRDWERKKSCLMSVDAESGGAKICRCVFLFNLFKLNFMWYHDYNATYPLYIQMRFYMDSGTFQS